MPFFNLTQGMVKLLFVFFKNGPTQASFVYLWWFQFIFSLFKQTTQFLQQINVYKCPFSVCHWDSNPLPLKHE